LQAQAGESDIHSLDVTLLCSMLLGEYIDEECLSFCGLFLRANTGKEAGHHMDSFALKLLNCDVKCKLGEC